MALHQRMVDWLETHWVAPAYSGWLALGLAVFFFGAATNTLAGWLYVMSGVMFALLAIAAILPERSLRGIQITRRPIDPVSAGDPLQIDLTLHNQTASPKTLIQLQDDIPTELGHRLRHTLELLPAQGTTVWHYELPTVQRGVYRWSTLQLRTGRPLGLFWCRRKQSVTAKAVVYPTVLPLSRCPVIDELGRDTQQPVHSLYRAQGATEGVTRTLRPYRMGDPIRLVHWRTSARYGELRVRELEVFTGGQEVIIALDSLHAWDQDAFEQAVIAAASLYFYALNHRLSVSVWTAGTGLLRGDRPVLETLAIIQPQEPLHHPVPDRPLIWLTQSGETPLPQGSRHLRWTTAQARDNGEGRGDRGLVIQSTVPLQRQLQAPLGSPSRP